MGFFVGLLGVRGWFEEEGRSIWDWCVFWRLVLGYGIDVDVVGTLGIASWYRLSEGSRGRLFLYRFSHFSSSMTFFGILKLDNHPSCRCVTVPKLVYLVMDILI